MSRNGAQAATANGASAGISTSRPAFSAFYVFPDDVNYHRQTGRPASSNLGRPDWGLVSTQYLPLMGVSASLNVERAISANQAAWSGQSYPISHSGSSVGTDIGQCHLSRYENVVIAPELDLDRGSTSSGFLRSHNSSMLEFMRRQSLSEEGQDRSLSVGGSSCFEENTTPTAYPPHNFYAALGPAGCAPLPLREKK
ncbi:unnamed protein product [Phytomonas sp. EM1]|nr:unnamed protein product [Phytomonas sp. EM1]|eukprot:CCW65426.1 unnamed protein product [Phytomonas sp. isolate EM1]